MRRYETILIVRPGNAGEEEISAVIDKVTGIIKQHEGAIIAIDKWGLKKLAYLIKKEQQGFYIYLEYAGQPDGVKEMERQLRIDDRMLKYMTVKTQDIYTPDAKKEEATDEAVTSSEETETKAEVPKAAAAAPAEEAADKAVASSEEAETKAEVPKAAAAAPAEEAADKAVASSEEAETAE